MTEVYLYIYDLSLGLAKKVAPILLDKSIEGIWHTSLVAFNEEYWYAMNGFNRHTPSNTPLGEPNEKILMGIVDFDQERLIEIIQEQINKGSYVFGEYNLFTHNCNCFSNDLTMTLFNKQIPEYIREMPLEAVTDLIEKPIIGKLFKSIYKKLITQQEGGEKNIHMLTLQSNADVDDGDTLFNLIARHLDEKRIKYSDVVE